MFDAKLVINGQEFPVHYKMLSAIAANMPEERNYAPLARFLLSLDLPSITLELMENATLEPEDLDAIWAKGDREFRRLLADSYMFRENLTDGQAREIMELNDVEILKSLANFAEQFNLPKSKKKGKRLSKKTADSLLSFMANHTDPEVRRSLAHNPLAPADLKPSFAECVESGIIIRGYDLEKVTEEDLDLLEKLSFENLKLIALSVEQIKNRKIREKVIDFLCSHPDPAIRLELIENAWVADSVSKRLANDPEPDVAQIARENLE